MRKNKTHKHSKQSKTFDKTFLLITILLTGIGLVALADASAPLAQRSFGDKFYFLRQQMLWAAIGVAFMFITLKIRYTFWEKIATPLFLLVLATLVVVLIPGIGTKILGARRWIFVGPISIQPSEFIKFALAIYFAKVADRNKKLAAFVVPLALIGVLIMLQPDLGTMMVIALIGFTQIFVSGANLIHFLGLGLMGVALSFLLIITSDYRRDRLLTFLQQTQDPLGKAYHIRQILLALGAGGFFGVGLGQSRQKYLFLPETATDSIFAVVAEEVGFLGATFLILLFVVFIIKGFNIAKHAPDTFSRVMSVGIMSWIGGQTLLNIGSMVAIIPLTGIPLPFFSYGGSSLTAILIACGIILNVSYYAKNNER